MIGTIYRVEINKIDGSGEAAGFIDPTRVENYPTQGTYAQNIDKERANYRYKLMLQSLQSVGNIYVINEEDDPVAVGGSATAAPSKIAMTLLVERGEPSLIADIEGEEMTGADLIRRLIAQSFLVSREVRCDIYDPTLTENAPRRGNVVDDIVVGALTNNLTEAEAAITVTKL